MDDIIVTRSNPSHVPELFLQLGKGFAMKDLVPLHFLLEIEVSGFHLNQSKYVAELLAKIEMTLAKVVTTPLVQKQGLHEAVESLVDTSYYRMIVESLQYLTLIGPDITHVANLASQFMQSSNIEHHKGVKRILRYIKVTLHFGLIIISQSPCCTTTRRSTIGYSIYLGANSISWTSKKHTTVDRSSAEAEYRALASTATEMTWILYLLHDLGVFLRYVP
uniref:Reverse transcriptase Ty1/copia-type domain-containing protein n=1 Tax=Solanum lycopersicum TaxID=4081 RepID=A0A3Q7FLG4_SOLLC